MFRLRITGNIGFEFWMDVPGYEGLYQASTYGRGVNLKTGKYFYAKPCPYVVWSMYKNGIKEHHNAQLWLARTFLPVPDNLRHLIGKYYPSGKPMLEVNHKNEDKSDNRIENLEWCTKSYNDKYGTRMNRIYKHYYKRGKPINQYTKEGVFVKSWKSAAEIEKATNYCNGNISKCCLGKNKTAYGFIWKFKENCEIEREA